MILSRFRPWLFLFFVASFAVTAATVLFFAFGYRYSFERGIFIYSGSITLKTTPIVVDVTIDGFPVSKKRLNLLNDSIHITGLMPGEHLLHISAPDYEPWEKKIVIGSGISREFWNIILPKTSYQSTSSSLPAVKKIFPHPLNANRLVTIQETGGETTLLLFDGEQAPRQVFSLPESHFDSTSKENLEWSWFGNGRFIALPLTVRDQKEHLVVDTNDGSFFSLEERLGLTTLRFVRWATDKPDELLFLSSTTLYRWNMTKDAQPDEIATDALGYSLSGDNLYLVRASGEIWQENGSRLVSRTPAIPFNRQSPMTLTVYDESHFALLEDSGAQRLFVAYRYPTNGSFTVSEVAQSITSMQFSNDGKKLLFANNNEMSVVFTDDWEVQPRRQAGDIVQVARFSEPISQVQWAENYEHLIFQHGSTVKFIELDGRDHHVIGNIITLPASPSQVLPNFATNELAIVIPDSGITRVTFPEPQSLFGQ